MHALEPTSNRLGRMPIVIAHRGASGYAPEHTLPAYLIAIEQGADFIELDLVMTQDGHLIARHDNELSRTTDVAARPELAARRTTKSIDGETLQGWFSEDFTLAEIQRLRAIERIPTLRPANARFNGMFHIPTLEEVIRLVLSAETSMGKRIGLYLETKHPTYCRAIGLGMEVPLVTILDRYGYRERDDPVYIQSFEIGNLRALRGMTRLRLLQLLGGSGQPCDVAVQGAHLTYRSMATTEGLKTIADYADGVGPEKYPCVLQTDEAGALAPCSKTSFVERAHAAGLVVHPYTFRAENEFLPANLKSSTEKSDRGDLAEELRAFLASGIDGFFVDHPDIGVTARDRYSKLRRR